MALGDEAVVLRRRDVVRALDIAQNGSRTATSSNGRSPPWSTRA